MSEPENELLIPTTFSYSIGNISLQFLSDDDNSITSSVSIINIKIRPKTNTFQIAATKAITFLKNIHGCFCVCSESPSTKLFVDGTLNVPSIEMPLSSFGLYETSIFLFYKVQAILGESAEVVSFEVNQKAPVEIAIQVDVDIVNRDNPFVDEKIWVEDLEEIVNSHGDTLTDEEINDLVPTVAWWRRSDGKIRDFFTIDEDAMSDSDIIRTFKISLGDDAKPDDDSNDTGGATVVTL